MIIEKPKFKIKRKLKPELAKEIVKSSVKSVLESKKLVNTRDLIKDRGKINFSLNECDEIVRENPQFEDTQWYNDLRPMIAFLKNSKMEERDIDKTMKKIVISESDDFMGIFSNKDELLKYSQSKNNSKPENEKEKNEFVLQAKNEGIRLAIAKKMVDNMIADLLNSRMYDDPNWKQLLGKLVSAKKEITDTSLYCLDREIFDQLKKQSYNK